MPPQLANSNCFKYRNHIINYNTYHSSVFFKNAIKSKTAKIQEIRSKTFNEFTYLRIFKYCLKFFFLFKICYIPPKTSKPLFLFQQKRSKIKRKKKTTTKKPTCWNVTALGCVLVPANSLASLQKESRRFFVFFFNINLETKLPACPYV